MSAGSEEVRVPVRGAVLAGTLLAPNIGARCPCLLLISGSGANDRDETVCGHTPFRNIAEYFVARGYAVLRSDDRGVGASTGDAEKQDFDGAIEDVVATYRWLERHPAVCAERIVLLGHSEGGLIGAAAGFLVRPWAVIMLSGPAVPIEALLHEQARLLSLEGGATAEQIEHERRMNECVFALARTSRGRARELAAIENVIREYLRSWPDLAGADDASINTNARLMATVVTAPAYCSLLRQDPAAIIGRLERPLLAVYGGKDVQVPGSDNADALRRITADRRDADCLLFPDHNHLLQQAVTGSISEYEALQPAPDPLVLRQVAEWLEKLQTKAGKA
jgi:pimeloyl-ACP methyl ester carboxylesterase